MTLLHFCTVLIHLSPVNALAKVHSYQWHSPMHLISSPIMPGVNYGYDLLLFLCSIALTLADPSLLLYYTVLLDNVLKLLKHIVMRRQSCTTNNQSNC